MRQVLKNESIEQYKIYNEMDTKMAIDYIHRYNINDKLMVGDRRAKRRTRCGYNGLRIIKKLQKSLNVVFLYK